MLPKLAVMNDLTLCFHFKKKSEKMSLTSIYEWENNLGRAYHCPEYSQLHTGSLLQEMCYLSGSCSSCLCSLDFSDENNCTYFCSWKLSFFMQKWLKKDFKDVKLLTDVSYDSLYKLFLKQSLGIVKTHFQHLTKIAFRPVIFAKIHVNLLH